MVPEPNLPPIPTPWDQRRENFCRQQLPWVVWSLTSLVCVWMLVGRAQRLEYVGIAQPARFEVSAPVTGRIVSIAAELHRRVAAGDVIARLDDTLIVAMLSTSEATLQQLEAQLEAARLELISASHRDQTDWIADLRRFQMDEEQARLEILELNVTMEGDAIELERRAVELRRASTLRDSGLIGEAAHDIARLAHDEVLKRIEENRRLLDQRRNEHATAEARRVAFEGKLPIAVPEAPLLRPLREALGVETQRMEEIRLQREALVLRSPVDGDLSQILCREGQAVVAGQAIVVITDSNVHEVIVYARDGDRRAFAPNERVAVTSLSRPGRIAESFVVGVASGFDLLPARLWLEASTPLYGRALVIAPVPQLELAPGELVGVRFLGS